MVSARKPSSAVGDSAWAVAISRTTSDAVGGQGFGDGLWSYIVPHSCPIVSLNAIWFSRSPVETLCY